MGRAELGAEEMPVTDVELASVGRDFIVDLRDSNLMEELKCVEVFIMFES